MTRVAVVAHRGKTFDGGLPALRRELARHGVADPLWFEVPKSRKAPREARRAVRAGAGLVLVWGGDGTVQRCLDVLAGTGVDVAVLPAGTANLLAANLGIPRRLADAVDVALHGVRRPLDLGIVNGERFAVMAGVGFDALMIADAGRGRKDRLGRLAYVWSGIRHLRDAATDVRVRVDGRDWFEGPATCVLLGNVGRVLGGIRAFDDARPDDGVLDVGVVEADRVRQWVRVLARVASGRAERSPLVRVTQGRSLDVRLARALPYELDGGDRKATRRLKAHVEPAAVTVCVPDCGDGQRVR